MVLAKPAIVEENTANSVKITVKPKPIDLDLQDSEPITDQKAVERFVTDYFKDNPILVQVAKCESRFRQYDSKGNVLRGVENNFDVGVMQINEKYHLEASKKLGLDIYTIEGNVAYAQYIYDKQGAKPWMSSSPCWAKYKQSEIARK